MATAPAFAATPKVASVSVSTANTGHDGTGTIATVFSAGASGSRVDSVVIAATGTTTAGMVRLFVHNGATAFLIAEVSVTAITPSGTTKAFNYEYVFPRGLVLPTGYSLRASTHNAENFSVTAFGGDF